MMIAGLSTDDLAQHCAEETARFSRHQPVDPQYCFELVRRALADDLPEAFTCVYKTYEIIVRNWVYSHHQFPQTGEDVDFFVDAALSSFYFALRGPKFGHFSSLPQVLSYLKQCVHTSISQYIRDQQPMTVESIEETGEPAHSPDLADNVDASILWAHICRIVSDKQDQFLVRCVFIQDMKPSEIMRSYPNLWTDERQISVALQRIRRILRRDAQLLQWERSA